MLCYNQRRVHGLALVCLLLGCPAASAQGFGVDVWEIGGFVHAEGGGYFVHLDELSPEYFSNLDAENYGTFGWTFTNETSGDLHDVSFLGYLDAEIDAFFNGYFNEYGEFVSLALPPGAEPGSIRAISWEIDEPGYLFGDIYDHLHTNALDNTNAIPSGLPEDVSLALGFGFILGSLAPGDSFTATFEISRDDIGGLKHVDPETGTAYYFNGHITVPNLRGRDSDGDGIPDGDDNCPDVSNSGQEERDGDGVGDACDDDIDGDGILNGADNCPYDPNSDQADNEGDSQGDVCDPDDDNDGVLDGVDNCPLHANPQQEDNENDGQGDVCDPDDDNDGVLDGADNCPWAANPGQADHEGDGAGDVCDPDDDNDGVPDVDDNCPWAANPGQADNEGDGQGDVCDPDDDNDSIVDEVDNCPFEPNLYQDDLDRDGLGDACDPDIDGDGVANDIDNCPFAANADQADNEDDGLGDACDPDDDNDAVLDATDNCPLTANEDQADLDGDGVGDVCDPDIDGDGVENIVDNCPWDFNADQADNEGDGQGDICDPDDDNDTVLDATDNCLLTANEDQADLDEDALGDACDPDIDGDGVDNGEDNCTRVANSLQDDLDGDGLGDVCDPDLDGDGVENNADNCPWTSNADQADNEGDGQGDLCDPDDDNDGVLDDADNCRWVFNPLQEDFDGGGQGDACDEDDDDDGVLDAGDSCPQTVLGEVVDPKTGCSLDQLCPCEGPRGEGTPWKNHGEYETCVVKTTKDFVRRELMTSQARADEVAEAARSDCGQKRKEDTSSGTSAYGSVLDPQVAATGESAPAGGGVSMALAGPQVQGPGWVLTRTVVLHHPMAAHYNPADELLYAGNRDVTGAEGLFRMEEDGSATRLCSAEQIAGVVADADGDVFFSEDYGGVIYRVAFGAASRQTWVSGFYAGDDDITGLAIAPADYTGSILAPGQAIAVDRGSGNRDAVWRWSPATAQGEVLLRSDSASYNPLQDAVDVAITRDEVYILDRGMKTIYRVGTQKPNAYLYPLVTSEPLISPLGIAVDPRTQDLLVTDRSGGSVGDRVVRIDPATGTVSEFIRSDPPVFNAYHWGGIDVRPDGYQVYVTSYGTDEIQTFTLCDPALRPGSDCDGSGTADECEILEDPNRDCNRNGVLDSCDIAAGTSADADLNGWPDECPSGNPGGPYLLGESAAHAMEWTATLSAAGSVDDSGIVSYAWDFGDGTRGSGETVSHTWPGRGPWTVTLIVTDDLGNRHRSEVTVSFVVGGAPVAGFTGPSNLDESSAASGQWPAIFDASGSTDDVGIWRYEWDFGNGETGTGVEGSTSYTSAGTYTVRLTVYDNAGQTDETARDIVISAGEAPTAAIHGPARLDETMASQGRWVSSWDGSASRDDVGIWKYEWDFGDGGTATGAQPAHTFTARGLYTVTLTVHDHAGQSATATHAIEVTGNAYPYAVITATPEVFEGEQPIILSALNSTDDFGIYTYRWDLPPRRFGFPGRKIDTTQWKVSNWWSQNERLVSGYQASYGTFFAVGQLASRGAALELRVDIPSDGEAVFGFKGANLSYTYLSNWIHTFLLYPRYGQGRIYEKGNRRKTFYFSKNTSYDFRIVSRTGGGAVYYCRRSGATSWTWIHTSSSYTNSIMSYGARVGIRSPAFGFDDISISKSHSNEPEVTVGADPGGPVTLTLTDHALQSHSETLELTPTVGTSPVAVIRGPTTGQAGADLLFDGQASSDDFGILSYYWDFGDSQRLSGPVVTHFYGSAGTYTVTLTVWDYSGQSASATQDITITGDSLVTCVPWRLNGDIELPHESWSGNQVTLKAAVPRAALPLEYTWDFGDGTAPASGSATTRDKAYEIQAKHVYSGPVGTPYTATIRVAAADGREGSDTYPILLRRKTLDVEMNAAIDDGLWYIHKTQTRYGSGASMGAYWKWHDYNYKFRNGVTASSVQAFEVNGHLPKGDASRDPYVETVRRGLTWLTTRLVHVNIGPQAYGDPDGNRNGIGLQTNAPTGTFEGWYEGGRPAYETGMFMDALAASEALDLTAQVGVTNVKGRLYRDILQDMVDMYCWGQYDSASVGGGWRYSWNTRPDNSVSQWGAIGLAAAEAAGLQVPQWVKDRNIVWVATTLNSNAGYGYTNKYPVNLLCCDNEESVTASVLVQLSFSGVPSDDPRWQHGAAYLRSKWWRIIHPTEMYHDNFYLFFTLAKAMELAKPEPVTRFSDGLSWLLHPTVGLARILLDRQRSDGSWRGFIDLDIVRQQSFSTPWAVMILTGSYFRQAPVAVVHMRPNPAPVDYEVTFDASASYHLHPFFEVVEYRWDFDASDGVDFTTPDDVGPLVQRAFPAPGTYQVTLQVKDNATPPVYDTATVTIDITLPPHPPTAVAGGPYLAATGEDLVLDGSGSFDVDEPDGDSIQAWEWEVDFAHPFDYDDGVTGETATFIGGFDSPGEKNIALRVTDRTSAVYSGSSSPDLTHVDFAEVTVYQRLINDLAARPKDRKIQLNWTHGGGAEIWYVQVYRSETGPNRGFEKIGVSRSTYAVYTDYGVQLNTQYYYRLLVYEDTGGAEPVGDPLGATNAVAVLSSPRSEDPNQPPEFTTDPLLLAEEGLPYVYDAAAIDPESDAVTFALAAGPSGMVIDPATGVVRFQPELSQVGVHDVFLEARDPLGGVGHQIYELLVRPVNEPPVAEANGPYAGLRGEAIAFSSAGSSDPDGDPLSFTWSFGDGNVSNEPNPTHVYLAAGDFVATLIVSDDRGGTVSDEAPVQIEAPDRSPIVELAGGASFTVRLLEDLMLDASGSYDLDGDPLTFNWSWGDSTAPDSGETGRHAYSQEGTYSGSVMVDDGRGGQTVTEFTVVVGPANQPPEAEFALDTAGVYSGDEWVFDAGATQDADGDLLSYHWDFGDGMTTTGEIVSHVYRRAGDYTVTLTVRDAHRNGTAAATLIVHVESRPPVLCPLAGQVVWKPQPFVELYLDDCVNDPDNDDSEIAWTVSGNVVLAVAISADRVVTIGYPPDAAVAEELTFTATDPMGKSASATATFRVRDPSEDDWPPVFAFDGTFGTVGVGQTLTIPVCVQDNAGVSSVTVLADGVPLPTIHVGGCRYEAEFTSSGAGLHVIEVVVIDIGGNEFTDSTSILVTDPSLTGSLTVAITSPAEDSAHTLPVDVIGTAAGPNFADFRLEYAPLGTNDYVEITRSTTPMTGGVLGKFDPTLLDNGDYELRATARTLAGQTARTQIILEADGQAKVGIMSVAFADKTLPIGVFPLSVIRSYDARDKRPGDFGIGWRMHFNSARLVERRTAGKSWVQTSDGGLFPVYSIGETKSHKVTISFGDAEKLEFRPVPNPSQQALEPIDTLVSMEYEPMGNTQGTLVAHQQPTVVTGGAGLVQILDLNLQIYNPRGFTYTSPEGVQFLFQEAFAGSALHTLTRITDPHGTSITLSEDGLQRSDGKGLGFARDGEGRITSITDPRGSVIRYEYDIRGDLVAFIDGTRSADPGY